MGKTTLVIQPEIDPNAVEHARKVLAELNPGDEITITVEAADAHQADPVIELLENNGFDFQPKGSHDGHGYHINAKKQSANN